MKPTRTLCALAAVGLLACGGADAPEPPTEEAPPAPEGVSGRAPAAVQGVPSVVILHPSAEDAQSPPDDVALMDQLGLAFLPTQLIVRAGQTIRFVNSESLAHNVHVVSIENDSTVFLADMDPDDRNEIVIDQEGPYDVTCDVHPGMRALIYVTSSPYAAFAEPDGAFLIPDVPPGDYRAEVWSASPDLEAVVPVEITDASTELDLTAFQ